jgi:glycosyltransferase involved in cell wall biosynthesis
MVEILMFPAQARANDNVFIPILVDALRENPNIVVRDFRPWLWCGDVDALHVHWLEGVVWGPLASRLDGWARWRTRQLITFAQQLRDKGRPVVWTVHNLMPHEETNALQNELFLTLRRNFLPLVTDVICMSKTVRDLVQESYPELSRTAHSHLIRHPSYHRHFSSVKSRLPPQLQHFLQRGKGPVIGSFGSLRRYKAIPEFIQILRQMDRPFRCLIAGAGSREEIGYIHSAISDDSRFYFSAKRLSDEELLGLSKACDLQIFNFSSILNSGSALAALSMGCPILAPARGALVDLARDVGGEWVKLFSGTLELDVLHQVLEQRPKSRMPDLSLYEPSVVASQLCKIYQNGTIRGR